jgi:hypothetical protein
VVFLADGRVVREMPSPTTDSILAVVRHLGE